MRYRNPWSNDPGFTYLGKYKEFDLYSLSGSLDDPLDEPSRTVTVDFGARFANNESSYISGEAIRIDGQWELIVGEATGVAAARFFANHYQRK